MKILDPLAFIVAHSLAPPGAPVPVKTHPAPVSLHKTALLDADLPSA
jgi:hypothetical protein